MVVAVMCPSGKLRYASALAANDQLAKLRARARLGDERRRELAAYACEDCGGWHLTSKPRAPARPVDAILADNPQRGALDPHALDDMGDPAENVIDDRYDDHFPGVSADFFE